MVAELCIIEYQVSLHSGNLLVYRSQLDGHSIRQIFKP